MTNYREILRLKSLGFSERNIALSCSVSRNTVSRVVQAASKRNISWPLDFDMTAYSGPIWTLIPVRTGQ